MSKQHIPQLDGLRAVAVILVLLAHSSMVFTKVPLFALWLDRYGSLGVQIFFVLSGFLITRILLATKDESHYFSSFFIRRGLRIYPLYYVVLSFVMFSGVIHQHNVRWWVYMLYLSNLVYGHTPQPAPLLNVWSLAVEEQFYLVWPFLVWSLSRRSLERLSIVIIGLAIVLRFGGYFQLHNTLLQLDSLAAGAFIASRADSIGSFRRVATVIACLMPLGMGFPQASLNSLSQTVQVLSGAALLVVLLSDHSRLSRWLQFPALRYIGMISYGIYLLHSFVFATFLRTSLATRVIESGSINQAILCLVAEWALVIALASLSFFLLERPFLRLKRLFQANRTMVHGFVQEHNLEERKRPALVCHETEGRRG